MMEWRSGKIGKNIELSMRLNGNPTKEKIKCRCGEVANLPLIADRELGAKLIQSMKILEDRAEWDQKWKNLMRKGLNNEVSLDEFFADYIKLSGRLDAELQVKEFTHSADISCSRCLTPFGKLSVTLRLIDDEPAIELTRNQLTNLKPSREMKAYASKRIGFENIEQLESWLADADAQKAAGILEKTIAELGNLALDYDTSKIIGVIRTQVTEIDREAKRRRIELVNVVEAIMRERIIILR